ncbi:MAG TPA: hypothetical protein VEX37_01440 [Thermomicrobiales bacterium]|nr:hypothetical protein [Thermomicrobiales bacterium]
MRAFTFSFRRLIVMLTIVATLMTSFVAAASTSGEDEAETSARSCVAHRSVSCRETPFPANRLLFG